MQKIRNHAHHMLENNNLGVYYLINFPNNTPMLNSLLKQEKFYKLSKEIMKIQNKSDLKNEKTKLIACIIT